MSQTETPTGADPLPPWVRRGSILVVMFAVAAPICIPFLLIGLPVLGLIFIMRMKTMAEKATKETKKREDTEQKKELVVATGAEKGTDSKEQEGMIGGVENTQAENIKNDTSGKAPAEGTDTTGNGAPVVGGAAILAKLRAARKHKSPKPHPVVVLYGSQTGTAAEVAKNISASIEGMGLTSRVVSMNEMGFGNLSKEKTPCVIWVASSTGDGEAPDNATKFYNDAKKKSQAEGMLRGIQFTCLGLGDSNYTRFMHVPRVLKNKFLELGATTFYEPKEADEVDGLEDIIDGWIEGLLPAVRAAVKPEETQGARVPPSSNKENTYAPLPSCSIQVTWMKDGDATQNESKGVTGEEYSASEPFLAPIKSAMYLTTDTSDPDRRVIHMQFDLTDSGIEYSPGDSLGVLPENDADLVDSVLKHLGLDGTACFSVQHVRTENDMPETKPCQHIKWPCSVRSAFMHGVDLTSPPKKSLLRVLAEYCSDAKEKEELMHLCSRDGRKDYMERIVKSHCGFCDVLMQHASCRPPFEVLLDALPPLAPRMYSVSSSPASSPHVADVAFTAVEYMTPQKTMRKGVATWWLEKTAEVFLSSTAPNGDESVPRVPLFLRKGGSFSTPSTLNVPWIMIGPGTGVSPFRGFLQQRKHMLEQQQNAEKAECWLFFGCRDMTKDYLYGKELESFVADGTLDQLVVAESRKTPNTKVYVQDKMRQHAAHLHNLIVDQNAYIFICGDGHSMARDVHNTLVDIVCGDDAKDNAASRKEAESFLAAMTKDAKYIKDVWS
ncbi:Methionine synthase reductase [Picochlorum sp. SENEW3]|nr:Methionine synthase reductase [Picochlorum sp. SENEW3]WPT15886.1 Methionine synthase reductase [Picochlorum sp. SENEW3]